MTVFQTVQNFEPQINVEFDPEKERYVGQLISRGGVYELSSPDRASISYEVDAILRSEYDQLVRDVDRGRVRSVGGSSSSAGKIQGHKIMDFSPPEERGRSRQREGIGANTSLDLLSMIGPSLPGLEAAAPFFKLLGIGTGLVELLELLLPLGGSKKKLAIVVGGVLIVAGSRRALMRKLMVHKNRVLQNIMDSLRCTLQRNEKQREEEMRSYSRLRMKNRTKNDWVGRVGKDKDILGKDWKDRVDSTKNRLREKRANAAVGLWAER